MLYLADAADESHKRYPVLWSGRVVQAGLSEPCRGTLGVAWEASKRSGTSGGCVGNSTEEK